MVVSHKDHKEQVHYVDKVQRLCVVSLVVHVVTAGLWVVNVNCHFWSQIWLK